MWIFYLRSRYVLIGIIMKSLIKYYIGFVCHLITSLSYYYKCQWLCKKLGGGKRNVAYPFIVSGVENIEMEDNVSIGPGATIYTSKAKLKIKEHVVSGPNLTVITGDHKYVLGRWIDSVEEEEKEMFYDKDVIIEEDVWIGCNVTILKGVTVGRSSIIGAGALVVNDVPPYSIVGGVPAKVLKMKWPEEQILYQERMIEENKKKIR